jgi:hypothetical protein
VSAAGWRHGPTPAWCPTAHAQSPRCAAVRWAVQPPSSSHRIGAGGGGRCPPVLPAEPTSSHRVSTGLSGRRRWVGRPSLRGRSTLPPIAPGTDAGPRHRHPRVGDRSGGAVGNPAARPARLQLRGLGTGMARGRSDVESRRGKVQLTSTRGDGRGRRDQLLVAVAVSGSGTPFRKRACHRRQALRPARR